MIDANQEGVELPRLAIISDVVPTREAGGELLLARLLSTWPSSQLLVVEGNLLSRDPERALSDVVYHRVTYSYKRAHQTRYGPHLNLLLMQTIRLIQQRIQHHILKFKPDAILTVSHGHLWLVAARVAIRLNVPLHLICHDEWARTTPLPGWAKASADRLFGKVYRQAHSRLCVSPGMAEEYERRYGAKGTILYPNRGNDSPEARLRAKPLDRSTGLVVGYAGSIWMAGISEQLLTLAAAIERIGGRLVVFTNQWSGPLAERSNISHGGFVPAHELADRLGEVADVLFVPMSFDPADAQTVATAFPSKLTDYTAIGLPLLIWGPSFCSAVRWAKEFPGVAEVVTEPGIDDLSAALQRLADDPQRRVALAQRGVEVGEQCFSLEQARDVFYSAVAGPMATETPSR